MSSFPPGLAKSFQAQKQGAPEQTDSGYSAGWGTVKTVEMVVVAAGYREIMLSAQLDYTITHMGYQEGPPVLINGDRFRRAARGERPERLLYVRNAEDPGELGLYTIYTLEERTPG